jgi:alpha-1-antitrypsin
MGITDLFTAESNLPFIAEQESLKVSDAIQTVVMEVDERGTKAAAATLFNVISLSLSPDPMKFELLIDQPFLAIIVNNNNKVPLFMAKIDNP